MADELDERRVRPLEVLEQERDGPLVGHALEEEPPGAEQLVLASGGTVFEAEEMEHARLDVGAFLLVRHELRDGACELGRSRVQAPRLR